MKNENPDDSQHTTLKLRHATVEDSNGLLELFRITYGLVGRPCQNPTSIRNAIASKHQIWIVADAGSSIVACLGIVRHKWNLSWEIACVRVDPRFHRSGLNSRMIRAGLRSLRPQPSELGFSVTHTPMAYSALCKTVDSVLVGHDGGPNVIDGVREYLMTAIVRPVEGGFLHFFPPHEVLLCSPVIKNRLYAPLGLRRMPGAYPCVYFVGSPGSKHDSLFGYLLDETSSAITLTEYAKASAAQREIATDLQVFVARHPNVAYVSACILSDKVELVRAMLEMGFEITAYLPAWYLHQNARYDCVMLVRRNFSQTPDKRGFGAEIELMDDAYAQLASQLCRPSRRPLTHGWFR
jgi:N-acetylglutamate synthase-like GNAT family acetyltransferase